jgi:hypothetical protein
LGVVNTAPDAAPVGGADNQRAAPIAIGAVASKGGLVDNLVEGGVDKVSKLYLGDGPHALQRQADADRHDGQLRQG